MNNLDIQAFLNQDQQKDLLRLLTCGSVDDGKSTLIGRLLFDSKKLYEDQLDALERDSKRVGNAGEEIDYALLLDGLKAEREQGITIDVAYRYFSTAKRKFIIADTPGHEQYTRNMITGGSTANLAILLIDARKGVITQTKRHSFLVNLLGIKHVVLAVNKMDLMDYSQEVYESICNDYKAFVSRLDIPDIHFVPISALKGDNVVELSEKMPWYHGQSMMELLETIQVTSDRNFDDFRFPVQYVLRPNLDFRGFSGKVSSGIIRKGDAVMSLPSRKTSRIKSIHTFNGDLEEAFPPQAVTLTLEDEIDASRGEMLVKPDNLPRIERQFEAMLVWMEESPMSPDTQYYIKHNTHTTRARIDAIRYKVDVNTHEKQEIDHFELNEIGRAVLTTVKPLLFDPYKKNRQTGAFVLIDPMTHNTVAVGMIIDSVDRTGMPARITDMDRERIAQGQGLIPQQAYQKRYNQKGSTIWITGLHGSGKNELAFLLEKELFESGAFIVVLEGSAVRSGLSRELDHSPADRAEHLRRVAHVCHLLNDQGIITICSFISPNEDIRRQVAEIIGPDRFHLIHMDASLEYSRNNKPEIYNKAEAGKLSEVPGLNVEYQTPSSPALSLKPEQNIDNVGKVMAYLNKVKVFPI